LAELELVRVGLAAAGDDDKIIRTLQIRGDAALREMAGKQNYRAGSRNP
jgi:hypothetical protein